MGGICASCCGSEEERNDRDNERQGLVNGISHPQPIEPAAGDYQRTNSVLKKNDEQSALNRILHKAARSVCASPCDFKNILMVAQNKSNVIDVAALDTHGLEQHEFSERAKNYSQKLSAATVQLKNRSRKKDLLPETSLPVERIATLPILPATDLEMIKNFSKSMEEAFKMFAVQHHEDLIVHFAMT